MLELALKQRQKIELDATLNMKSAIEELLKKIMGQKVEIVGENSHYGRAVNTSLVIFKEHAADFLLALFDIESLCVSMGAACFEDVRGGGDGAKIKEKGLPLLLLRQLFTGNGL